MPPKYTRPDQFYGKTGKPPRDIPDIRRRILPAFAVLLVLEIGIALATFRFWSTQSTVLEDQRVLFRANEIVSEAHHMSMLLSRLAGTAINSPGAGNIRAYADALQKNPSPLLNAPQTPEATLNSLADVAPSRLDLRNSSLQFGEEEQLRFDRVVEEFMKLRAIDEKALADLEKSRDAASGADTARSLLEAESYEARRLKLGEDFADMRSALDLRILSLINTDSAEARIFFPSVGAALVLLFPATILLGWFLHRHESRLHVFQKNQVRRLTEELSSLRGGLSRQAPFARSDSNTSRSEGL